ncbi:MAG: hypothetical protein KF727_02830 [Microbacteriaceae bacterium]|nr:hypothetical protein [Microbacteriaceae bacterium]
MIDDQAWRYEFLLARDMVTASGRVALASMAARGELVRVCRGAYLPAERWNAMGSDERYRTLARAVATTSAQELVFSHASAAALWQLPWLGRWPTTVHVLGPVASGGRSTSVVQRHAVGVPPRLERVEGLTVTSLGRTVVDVARLGNLERAVAVADAALHRYEIREALAAEVELVPMRHGSARARYVVGIADGLAESPGESLSRVTMMRAGVPPPVLQQEFPRERGGVWAVDFWWPEQRIIGEFDGKGKYLDPQLTRGRSAAEIVYQEKLREDELRRQSEGFARWEWRVARDPAALVRRLRSSGLRW